MEIDLDRTYFIAISEGGTGVVKEVKVLSVSNQYCIVSYEVLDKKERVKRKNNRILQNRLYCEKNIAELAASKIRRKKGSTKTFPFWEPSDFKKMVDGFTEKKQWGWRLAFMLSFISARRIGDILELKWEDFFHENGRKKEKLIINEEKTGKDADVLITDLLWEEIELFMGKKGLSACNVDLQANIFPGTKRKSDAYRTAFKKVAELKGINYPVSPHSTRRSWGYYSMKLFPNDPTVIYSIQQYLNHDDLKTTLGYIGLSQEKLDNLVRGISDMISDTLDGGQIEFDHAPVITLKCGDLMKVIQKAYADGKKNAEIMDVETHLAAVNELLNQVIKKI